MKLIDAYALINHIVKKYGLIEVILDIDEMPAIDAEPVVHGRWIGKPIAGYSTVRCSACRSVFSENNGKWNYCPNCGAVMDEVNDGTETG